MDQSGSAGVRAGGGPSKPATGAAPARTRTEPKDDKVHPPNRPCPLSTFGTATSAVGCTPIARRESRHRFRSPPRRGFRARRSTFPFRQASPAPDAARPITPPSGPAGACLPAPPNFRPKQNAQPSVPSPGAQRVIPSQLEDLGAISAPCGRGGGEAGPGSRAGLTGAGPGGLTESGPNRAGAGCGGAPPRGRGEAASGRVEANRGQSSLDEPG